jgi:hypothetical protein
MKRILLLMTFVVCACSSVWADSACPAASPGNNLAAYDVSGFACTVGDVLFSDFSYSPSGSNIVPDSSVTVTPETVGSEVGLQFNAPWGTDPGGTTDSFIMFTASCATGTSCTGIDDLVLTIGGASPGGPGGFVIVSETSSVLTASLQDGTDGSTTTLSDMGTFAPVSSVTVMKDIEVNGATTGLPTQVSDVSNLFSTTSAVPEPSTLFLCMGLLGLVPVARRKFGF